MRLIDADALIFKCKQISTLWWNKEVAPDSWAEAYEEIIDDIEEAPTIDAEPVKHAHWINKGNYSICSECGLKSGTQYDGVELVPLETSFCGHCGATMDGGTTDEDNQ